jgi:hypothetical protein
MDLLYNTQNPLYCYYNTKYSNNKYNNVNYDDGLILSNNIVGFFEYDNIIYFKNSNEKVLLYVSPGRWHFDLFGDFEYSEYLLYLYLDYATYINCEDLPKYLIYISFIQLSYSLKHLVYLYGYYDIDIVPTSLLYLYIYPKDIQLNKFPQYAIKMNKYIDNNYNGTIV